MEIIENIKKWFQNKKIEDYRKKVKELNNIICTLTCFINDRKEMDIRNLDRANEIKSVCEVQFKTPQKTYDQAKGICTELKSSIVASTTLLNKINLNKLTDNNSNINKF